MRKRPLRDELIAFCVTKAEKERISDAAVENDQSISDYCRKVLLASCMKESQKN